MSAGATLQSPRWPAARSCREEDLSEEAATPGQPERGNAFTGTLQQSTLENCRNRWSAAMFQQTLRTSNVSLQALCVNRKLAATENRCLLVQKLWRAASSCGRFWKKGGSFAEADTGTESGRAPCAINPVLFFKNSPCLHGEYPVSRYGSSAIQTEGPA
jgi:hypothetical protein